MGYRSDVKIAFYVTDEGSPADWPVLKLWFEENFPLKQAVEEWNAETTRYRNYILIHYDDVKWYNGYPHVEEVRECLERFNDTFDAEHPSHLAWEMARIGEEQPDIEYTHSGWANFRMNIVRFSEFS